MKQQKVKSQDNEVVVSDTRYYQFLTILVFDRPVVRVTKSSQKSGRTVFPALPCHSSSVQRIYQDLTETLHNEPGVATFLRVATFLKRPSLSKLGRWTVKIGPEINYYQNIENIL